MLQRVLRSWVPLDIPLGHPRCPDPGALSHVQRPEFRQTWLPLLTTKDRITTALNDWAYVREQRVFLEQRVLLRLPPDDTPIELPSLFAITRLLDTTRSATGSTPARWPAWSIPQPTPRRRSTCCPSPCTGRISTTTRRPSSGPPIHTTPATLRSTSTSPFSS